MKNMNNETKDFILKELSNFSFKRYTKGFKYLNEAIYLCIEDNEAMNNLQKRVFTNIAKRYNEKSPLNVKWCIEQSIRTMYNNTEMKKLCEYFNVNENTKPSLKSIIYTIVCKYEWKNYKK